MHRSFFSQVTKRWERLWVTVSLGEERRRIEVQRLKGEPERYGLIPPEPGG